MKILKHILVWTIGLFLAVSCETGIDPITPATPGSDETAPTITVNNPGPGEVVKAPEGAGIHIDLVVEDDIELQSVVIHLDGSEVANITEFKDYRRYAPIGGHLIDEITGGSHVLKVIATDLTGKSTTLPDLPFEVIIIGDFVPAYDEIFYMSFDNHVFEFASISDGTVVGTVGYETGKIGNALASTTDSYVTFPGEGLLNAEFSATFWYKVNATPNRSGILTVTAPNDNADNTRITGFRLFREAAGANQIIKGNVGNGTVEQWLDGGANAQIDPTLNEWVHVGLTISLTHLAIYLNGVIVSEADFGPIDWGECDGITIASGEPNFTYWDHKSDLSLYDELRIYDKALTQSEIQAIIDAEQ